MMRVVEQTHLPVFILHDCLICQKDEELVVGNLMQDVYVKYCHEQGWTPVAPAYSIERNGSEKHFVSGRRNPWKKECYTPSFLFSIRSYVLAFNVYTTH